MRDAKTYLDYLNYFIARKVKVFSTHDLDQLTKDTQRTKTAINSMKKNRWLKPLAKGLYAIYSSNEREHGQIPHTHYIDQLMSIQKMPYYIGLLSAAEIYGATHYRSRKFQVITRRQYVRGKRFISDLDFHVKSYFTNDLIEEKHSPFGTLKYSKPELILYDLIKYEREIGTISNAILVIKDLLSACKASNIKRLVNSKYEVAYIQRLGYILDRLGASKLADPLRHIVKENGQSNVLSKLGSKESSHFELSNDWKILVNYDWNNLDDT